MNVLGIIATLCFAFIMGWAEGISNEQERAEKRAKEGKGRKWGALIFMSTVFVSSITALITLYLVQPLSNE